MRLGTARTHASRLAAGGGRKLLPRLRAAQRRRYFRELALAWDAWHDAQDEPKIESPEHEAAAEEALARLAPLLSRRTRFLDLGCGDGCVLKRAAPRCARADGADVSARALRRARRNTRGLGNVALRRVGGFALDVAGGSYDLVLCRRMLSHLDLEPVAWTFREVHRVLAPKGRFVFDLPDLRHEPYLASVVSDDGNGWPGIHRPRFWTPEAAKALVTRAGFTVERVVPGPWFEVRAVR
ncbi:MAG: class I SAM-dependent methyltransferase [Elusimicrobia bacterium]|nr:class I SAM-dependent methyltransferase [Elusimicrobiota bacterium]